MKTIIHTIYPLSRARVALLGAILAVTFTAAAGVIPPGGMAATPSGRGDVNLSFPTTSPKFYIVQASPDLLQWTNCQSGIAGNGAVETVTLSNGITGRLGFYRLAVLTPTGLTLPQGTAFGFLGHSCGGIQEQVSAGFDPVTGYPLGVVGLSTSCGGSGRGGGYHTTKYTVSALVMWDFAGNVVSSTSPSNGVPAFTPVAADGLGDFIYNTNGAAYLVVPVPAAPTGVSAGQTGDQLQVSWTPNGVNPVAVTSSAVTATPVNSPAPILATTVNGPGTIGIIPSVQPQTTYQITVLDTTIGGAGPASTPVNVTTLASTIPPAAPTNVVASWLGSDPSGATDSLSVTWQAPDPGDSPIDQYLVTITGSEGAGTFTQTVDGTTFTAWFTVNYVPDWSVTVKAHNAAGWGPASATFRLGGL